MLDRDDLPVRRRWTLTRCTECSMGVVAGKDQLEPSVWCCDENPDRLEVVEVVPASEVEQLRQERDNLRELAEGGYGEGVRDTHTATSALFGEWKARVAELEAALRTAADDLGKAANQFASMCESQRAGHMPTIERNPERFAEKGSACPCRPSLRSSWQTRPLTCQDL